MLPVLDGADLHRTVGTSLNGLFFRLGVVPEVLLEVAADLTASGESRECWDGYLAGDRLGREVSVAGGPEPVIVRVPVLDKLRFSAFCSYA